MKEVSGAEWSTSSDWVLRFKRRVEAQQPFVIRGARQIFNCAKTPPTRDFLPERLLETLGDVRVPVISTAAKFKGRVGFRGESFRFNFERSTLSLSKFLSRLKQLSGCADALMLAMQTAPLDQYLSTTWRNYSWPAWADVVPRIWVGNRSLTVPHYDDADNFALVIAGRRRFRLFPPVCAKDLYVAPLERSPSGAPITVVDPARIDYSRYPNYANAVAVSQEVTLEAGDGIFIPTLWWHEVESLSDVNVLMNFWRGGTIGDDYSVHPIEALILTRLALQGRNVAQRRAWRDLFDAWAFEQDPLSHVDESLRGVLGELTDEQIKQFVGRLTESIKKRQNK